MKAREAAAAVLFSAGMVLVMFAAYCVGYSQIIRQVLP